MRRESEYETPARRSTSKTPGQPQGSAKSVNNQDVTPARNERSIEEAPNTGRKLIEDREGEADLGDIGVESRKGDRG